MTAQLLRDTGNKVLYNLLNLFQTDKSNIVIVGNKDANSDLKLKENHLEMDVYFCEPKDVYLHVNNNTVAILVDEKNLYAKVKSFLTHLLDSYKFLPVFFLSRNERKPSFYGSLYEKGLYGVIAWPRESKRLYELIVEALKPHSKTYGHTKGDERLSEMVKSHLVLNGRYKKVKVKVISGFVFIVGKVKSLFDKRVIERESSKVLGVKSVITKDLVVKEDHDRTDTEIERKIKLYIGHRIGSEKKSISVKVRKGIVTILGAATSPEDIKDIETFAMKQVGIKRLVNKVKYQPSLVSRNINRAQFLEEKVKNIFDGVRYISISIFGDFAEVSGTVEVKSDKKLIEDYLVQSLPIRKVVNKLYVAA